MMNTRDVIDVRALEEAATEGGPDGSGRARACELIAQEFLLGRPRAQIIGVLKGQGLPVPSDDEFNQVVGAARCNSYNRTAEIAATARFDGLY